MTSRLALVLLATAGCRQLLGLDEPAPRSADAAAVRDGAREDGAAAPSDGPATDAGACSSTGAMLPTTVLASQQMATLTVTGIMIGNGGQMAMVAPGQSVPIGFMYTLTDTSCSSNCLDQIEIGLVPGHRTGCVFDGTVSKTTGVGGAAQTTIPAPSAAGAYDVRVNIGQNYSCTFNGASDWWSGTPPASATIARLCVQ